MSLALKPGVSLQGLLPPMLVAVQVAEGVFAGLGRVDPDTGAHCVVTSATDGEHSQRSRHYIGAGVDLRTRHLRAEEQALAHAQIKTRLGGDFVVLLEATHIHIQWTGRSRD